MHLSGLAWGVALEPGLACAPAPDLLSLVCAPQHCTRLWRAPLHCALCCGGGHCWDSGGGQTLASPSEGGKRLSWAPGSQSPPALSHFLSNSPPRWDGESWGCLAYVIFKGVSTVFWKGTLVVGAWVHLRPGVVLDLPPSRLCLSLSEVLTGRG